MSHLKGHVLWTGMVLGGLALYGAVVPAVTTQPQVVAAAPAERRVSHGAPELSSLYATILQRFQHDLTDLQAEAIAVAVVEESQRKGVDPRLLVATVSAEGVLDHVTTHRHLVRIGKEPVRRVVSGIAADLRRRLDSQGVAEQASPQKVRLALLDRRAEAASQLTPSETPEQYAVQVMARYQELGGQR